jgi:hypothetical protein
MPLLAPVTTTDFPVIEVNMQLLRWPRDYAGEPPIHTARRSAACPDFYRSEYRQTKVKGS